MKGVILPKRNEKDLKEVDDNVKVREGGGERGMGHRERERKGHGWWGRGMKGVILPKRKEKDLNEPDDNIDVMVPVAYME